MKILVVHGPNMNLLGTRETELYGRLNLDQINSMLLDHSEKLGVTLDIYQSNHEGGIVDKIQEAGQDCCAVLINPAALTHYSYAVRDALAAVGLPYVEVHMSNIFSREPFRSESVTAPRAAGVICGFGADSYLLGIEALVKMMKGADRSC